MTPNLLSSDLEDTMKKKKGKPTIHKKVDIRKLIQEMQEKYDGSSLTEALLRERAADLEREEADIRYWGEIMARNKAKEDDQKTDE